MSDTFDDEFDVAAAQRLDAQIAAALGGRPARDTDPTVLWLANSLRPPTPDGLADRIGKRLRPSRSRSWGVARVAALVLALLLVTHGLTGYFIGEYIARGLHEPFAEHVSLEAGLAFAAAGCAVAAGALRRRWLPVAVLAGVPLGLSLAAHGIPEVTHFAGGAVLHLAEGAAALVLLVAWLVTRRRSSHRRRRYGGNPNPQDQL